MRTTLRAVALFTLAAAALPGQSVTPDMFRNLTWRTIGPEGNRFTSAAGIPGDPLTYYVGAASGGVWKTTDGGTTWASIFDAQPVQSIGSITVAKNDPNIVWVGTGEAHIRSHVSIGEGIYKSTDAGQTWRKMGLDRTGRIARIVIDPANPNIVMACALGHAYGPQPERGVFRTTDGGATWNRVLFTDENAGCSELVMNPQNPQVLYAGMWTLEIHTWGRNSGGPGSGLFKSSDGGVTWTRLRGNGLPAQNVGKVEVAVAPSTPNRVYVLMETGNEDTEDGQLWRSENAGDTWTMVSKDLNAMGRAHYYSRMVVAPDNANEAYFLTASYAKTTDGGANLVTLGRGGGGEFTAPGGDHHDIWIDPTNANRQIVAHDQGLSITQNRGRTWYKQRLLNAQIYHVTVDNEIPYNVLGNKQDEPSYRGPSNSRVGAGGGRGGGISRGMWHSVGGGESGWATPDPTNSKLVWSTASGSGMVGGIVVRFDENNRQLRNVEVWPAQLNGPAEHVKYRFVWDAPLLISPHDHNTIYVGSQHVHRTTNGGQSWEVISPDLTLNDRSKMGSSGGLTPDNIGVEYAGVVYGIAESPIQKGMIWVGTNDGLVQLTKDNGRTWTNLTKNIPDLPPWGSVRSLVASKYDANTAYITVDFHQVNGRDPYIYRTKDGGQTWKKIVNGIPVSMLSYAKVIHEDPKRRNMLYVGTENAIYVSYDEGDNWLPLNNNLPAAPVSGIQVQEHFDDLVVSTYGRGFWIMDDIGALRELTPTIAAKDVHLFTLHPAYRFRAITAPSTTYDDPTTGTNPQYGVAVTYYLKAPSGAAPRIEILDERGTMLRQMTGPNLAGINRMYWDLRHSPSIETRLRTSPIYSPHIPPNRTAPGTGRMSILAPPGTYTVRLIVNGQSFTQPAVVRKDPNSTGTEAEILAQTRALIAIRGDMDAGANAVMRMEDARVALDSVGRIANDAAIKSAAEALHKKVTDLEMNLVDLRLTGQGQDGVRFGAKLLSRLNYLQNGISGSDFAPTTQAVEVQGILSQDLKTHLNALDQLLSRDLEALNGMLRAKGMPPIRIRPRSPVG